MTDYCTLAQVRAENKSRSTDTDDDAQLRRYIRQVSRRIDSVMGSKTRPFFAPYLESRQFLVTNKAVDSFYNTFLMRNYCLSLTTVVRGITTITAYVELYNPYNTVAQALRITSWNTSWYVDTSCSSDSPPSFVTVTGMWGWHEDYDNAWDHVDDVLDVGGINAAVTTITVANADGADPDGFTPRFSEGNLIKIDDEFMDVVGVDVATEELTVRRGVNGTTAAIHALNADISTYRVDERINRVAIRQAALLYARRGAFQVESMDGVGVVSYPQDLLSEMRAVVQEFQYG